jgi:DNA invertase Pin-like site-specific DNA recombinase
VAELVASSAVIPAISYARVSNERQLRGEGMRRQLKGTREWIEKHPELRIRLDLELSDAARSAWKGDHVTKDDAALGKLLKMVETDELRPPLMVIVEALDRLSRQNPWQAQSQLAGLVSRGIIVATTQDDQLYSLDSGIGDIILSVVAMSRAHEESESKSQRVRQTKTMRVLQSMETKQVLHQNVPHWLVVPEAVSATNRLTRRVCKVERHTETVRLMYEMALFHGATYITSWLMRNRQAFGRSGKWNTWYVRQILTSRATIGHLEAKSGIIENIFPPVVPEELWLRVQAAMEARRGHSGAKTRSFINVLAGFCRCADCDGNMRVNGNAATGYRYYECKNHSSFHTCANRSRYRVDMVEEAILSNIGWIPISTPAHEAPANVHLLVENLETLKAREARLAEQLQKLDSDDMADLVLAQLRELRARKNDAATALLAAKKRAAVAASPVVEIGSLTDRAKLHAALKDRIQVVLFGEDNIAAAFGGSAVMVVCARIRKGGGKSALCLTRSEDGKMAVMQEGRLVRIADAPDSLPLKSAQTIADVRQRIREFM